MVAISTWIIDSDTAMLMIPYKCSFDTYDEILVIKIWLGDNDMVQTIGMESIVVEIVMKHQI